MSASAIVVRLPPPAARVELRLPGPGLSANAPKNSARIARSRAVRAYRAAAGWAFKAVAGQLRLQAATVRATFYWPDRRRRDSDNAAASLKAAWDGLEDAGIVPNDAALTHLPPRFRVDRERPRVEIEVFACELRFEAPGEAPR